jgi:hypothetical protein
MQFVDLLIAGIVVTAVMLVYVPYLNLSLLLFPSACAFGFQRLWETVDSSLTLMSPPLAGPSSVSKDIESPTWWKRVILVRMTLWDFYLTPYGF